MELYQLRQLIAFAECGSLSKAAETVHTSQSALSRAMKNLEDELGVPLFSRTKNSIALTETGELAARHAQIVVSAHNDMIRTVREEDRRRRSFSFGSIAPAPIWELTPILSERFPGKTVSTDLQEKETALIRGLDDGAYNLIILLHPLEKTDSGGKPRYLSKPFIRENLFVLLPSSHRLAKKSSLQLRDLAGEKILIHNKIGFWYPVCRRKIPDAVFLEQSELSALREIVRATDLPSFRTNVTNIRDADPHGKVAVPLSDPDVNVQFWCVCLAEKETEYAPLFAALEKRYG
ncbi:LysR family transcriptional regulator [Treponema parvum]|uniref:LysR family transcriptional regulator n=1 Tax=Treponema parvum TaxID=138851 RepID=A0A975IBH8_9SPIR|nr:LysR family transcriptional regulator [Treponema parvum]QTQ10843.1 LysR family transcriptional regulator [Treponema parvum]